MTDLDVEWVQRCVEAALVFRGLEKLCRVAPRERNGRVLGTIRRSKNPHQAYQFKCDSLTPLAIQI